MTAVLYVISLALIVSACELFTNAVEWAGFRLSLAQGATGSLIAAVGAALPEAVVPVVALVGHSPSADSVATGAVLGAPFLLLTLGVAVTGVAVLSRRTQPELRVDPHQVRRDLGTFLGAFAVALASAALPHGARIAVGIGLLLTYGAYVIRTLSGGVPAEEMPEPLHLVRWRGDATPAAAVIALQLVLATGMIVGGSTAFVAALDRTAAVLHANPLVLAVVLIPLATELPETLNSVLWVRSGDDGLAFGNVAGSSTFQACILGFIGVTFTSWRPGTAGMLTAVITLATAAGVLLLLRDGRAHGRWLLVAATGWVAYTALQLTIGGALGGGG